MYSAVQQALAKRRHHQHLNNIVVQKITVAIPAEVLFIFKLRRTDTKSYLTENISILDNALF